MSLKNYKQTKEHREKISKALKGRKISKEAKDKISAALKGREVWNKGKKGLQVAWNKGMPMSEESKQKLSKTFKCKGGAWNKGLSGVQKCSEETRKKISEAKKGQPSPNKGKKLSEAQKRKMS